LDGNIIAGDFPPKQTKYIVAWADIHKDELSALWESNNNMGIEEKLKNAKSSNWLSDSLVQEEKAAAAMSAEVASYLQKYRKTHDLTQDDFAEILHVSKEEIIRWEDGVEDFTLANLAEITTALNLYFRNIFGVLDK